MMGFQDEDLENSTRPEPSLPAHDLRPVFFFDIDNCVRMCNIFKLMA